MSFSRQQGSLVCDGVPLADAAAAHGTPLYVYSAATIAARYRAVDDAFDSYPHTVHYALKANSTLAIVRLLRSLGSKVDANSGGEIDVALRAGFIPPEIVFTGVGKTPAELVQAIDLGVKTISGGMNPARSATSISPPELASTLLPRLRNRRTIASAELALSA